MRQKLFTTIVGSLAAACLMAIVWAAPATTSAAGGTADHALGLAASAGMTDTGHITDTGGITNFGQLMIANAIANHFGVSVDEVLAVRADMGWGEVFKVFYYAQLSGKTVDEILALREDDGWGVIAKSLGFHPGLGKNNLGQTLKEQRVTATPTLASTGNNPEDKKPKDKDKNPQSNPGNAKHDDNNHDNGNHGNQNDDKPDHGNGHGH